MKNIWLILSLITVGFASQAQNAKEPKYKMVTKDTINIRGVVYDYLGKPVPHVAVYSTNKEFKDLGYPIVAGTDDSGRFVLKGTLPKDTLTISASTELKIINNGSRYMEIKLPTPPKNELKDTISITAKRETAKRLPTFKVLTGVVIMDYYGIVTVNIDASYPGNHGSFQKMIRSMISYPKKAIENNIEGEVEIGFTIERDGSVLYPKIIKGIGYGCDDAVINAVKKSPKWKPALQPGGRPVIYQASVVIDFKLTD